MVRDRPAEHRERRRNQTRRQLSGTVHQGGEPGAARALAGGGGEAAVAHLLIRALDLQCFDVGHLPEGVALARPVGGDERDRHRLVLARIHQIGEQDVEVSAEDRHVLRMTRIGQPPALALDVRPGRFLYGAGSIAGDRGIERRP